MIKAFRWLVYVVLLLLWVIVVSQMIGYWLTVDVFNLSSTLYTALLHLLINGVFVCLFHAASKIKE